MRSFLLLAAFCAVVFSNAQISEGFESLSTGGYSNGPFNLSSGNWTGNAVLNESATNSRTGSKAARINDDVSNAHLTTPIINGVGVVTFYVRELNSGGGSFILQKSTDGVSFTNVDTRTYSGNTYVEETFTVNDANSIYLRILSDDNAGHLIIDDFSTTAFGAGNQAPVITNISQSIATPDTTQPVTISADITDDSTVASDITAVINWGTTSGTLSNQETMSLSVAPTFIGAIPAFATNNTTIYYEVVATDDDGSPLSTSSGEQSYLVQDPIPAPEILISEIIQNPSGTDTQKEYFEIYNYGTTSVDINGWTISDDGADSHTIAGAAIVPAMSYYVLARNNDISLNGGVPVDYVYTGITLSNSDDEIILTDTSNNVIDRVAYDGGPNWLDPNGASMEFVGTPSDDNNDPAFWQEAKVSLNFDASQANPDAGSPGVAPGITYIYNGISWFPSDPVTNSTNSDCIEVNSGTIAFTGDVDALEIYVATGATLDLGANFVYLYGDLITDGTLVGDDSTLLLFGTTGNQNVYVNGASIGDLDLVNTDGATLNDEFNLLGSLNLTTGTLTTNDHLVFKSSNGQSAVIGLVPSIGAGISGDVTVEQFYPARRAFRLVSSPVDMSGSVFTNWQDAGGNTSGIGTHITGGTSGGFDISGTNNPSMFGFSSDMAQSWNPVAATNNLTLAAGDPYRLMIRGDRSVSLTTAPAPATDTKLITKGTLHTGPDIQMFANNLSDGQFVFVGNPYQSKVNAESVLTAPATQDINPQFMYVWNPQAGNSGLGAYRTYDYDPAVMNPVSPPDPEVDGNIQPGQAVFFAVLDDNMASFAPQVGFSEFDKVMGSNTTATYSTPSIDGALSLSLFSIGNSSFALDGISLKFSNTGNNAVDRYDLKKLNNLNENIAIQAGSESLSIGSYSIPQDGTVIPLQVYGFTSGDYRFAMNYSNISTLNAYLKDNLTGINHPIANGGLTEVNLNFDTTNSLSVAVNRFELVFSNSTLGLDDAAFAKALSLYPNPVTDGMVTITGMQDEAVQNVKLTNMLGQVIAAPNYRFTENGTLSVELGQDLNTGIYLLLIDNQSLRVIIK